MKYNHNTKISVLIITLNEEKHMSELLAHLEFADEIIVVDSFSNDNTKMISESFVNVRFIQNPFENYTAQRNFAIELAANDWVLFIDADERLTDDLKQEIIETVNNNPVFSAYLVKRKFMFKNKLLRFSGWQTDKIFRLFDKRKARYINERLVHEKLAVNGRIGKLKHYLIHFSYSDYQMYKLKMVSYGKLKAIEAKKRAVRPTLFHYYIKPGYKFLNQYILRLGVLDGRKGIIICYLNALSVYVRYQELKKLNRKTD